jgi:ABC-type branched-subunit amino acid transport system permease subunit
MLITAPFAPLLARYRGIFFSMLTLALSMVGYGLLVKTESLGGSDGFNMGRVTLWVKRWQMSRCVLVCMPPPWS